ncbi:hypothetical protein TRIATDRAFT_282746 [Trichoderma atroviride IMI 206040]|uniref:Peptidase C14 caspase domain-containing protein n=1 Tax=Hypocrea atroviridis (strain ATCC 20476 / IMI 206040) TaxID=452589 RepID=G9NQF6_HYPAI|nr:uncharacterized protein TRIATDRAFT_282746 [Trichoderma atroviride IMI 206040]EHK47298.1 hypothetical protein TRIATDRAFT_282746 [Trichoderma atroviride IMI 206040]
MCTDMPKRYALLIGIDVYLNDGSRDSSTYRKLSLHNLRGCKNDVEAINDFLRDEYKFEKISILSSPVAVIKDEEKGSGSSVEPQNRLPTFANIEAEFDAVYVNAAAGDFFFFHYSGHGALLPRQKDSPKSSRMEEPSLITADFCCGQPAVRGWKLNQWLRKLNKKGIQIVVTLDSCYSGGSWRTTGEYISYRTPNNFSVPSNLPIEDQTTADSHNIMELVLRDAGMESSWSINPNSFTLIAACGIKEKAAEKAINGKLYGAFTWELLQYLRKSNNNGKGCLNVTYRMISDQLNMRLEGQTPAVYGRDRLLFFGSYEPFSVTPLVMQLQDNKVVIPAGRAHGINVGSEFRVLPEIYGVALSVNKVEEFQCNAIVSDEFSLKLKEGRPVVISSRWSLGEEGLRVYVDPAFGSDFRNKLQNRLEERIVSPIKLLDSIKNETDVLKLDKLGEDDAVIQGPAWLTGTKDPVRPLNLRHGSLKDLAAEAALALAHLARFRQILLLQSSSLEPPPFSVDIKPANNGPVANLYPLNQKFKFMFENKSDDELYITVIVLSPNFSIEQLYPSRDYPQTISPGSVKSFNFSMALPDGPEWVKKSLCRTFRRDIIRTLVTRRRPVSWKSLEQPNIWDASLTSFLQKPSSTRESSAVFGPDVDWWSDDQKIITGSCE